MGGVVAGGVLHRLGEGGQAGAQGELALVGEPRDVGIPQRGLVAAPLGQHRADPGMGVLDVIDRVLVALGLGEIQVEVQVLVGFAQHVEEAAGIVAHFFAQLAQGDELAGARTHGGLLALAVEHGKLHQRHLEPGFVQAEGLDRPLHARDVAVVVGAPDVDHAREAALVLVEVVGDVRGEIGVEAVLPLHDPVLLVAELGGTEPLGAVLQVDVAVLLQESDGLLHQPRVEERLLREPGIEVHAELGEIVAAVAELLGQRVVVDVGIVVPEQRLGLGDQRVEMALRVLLGAGRALEHLGGGAHVAGAVRRLDGRRHVAHIVALVGVLRERDGDAVQLEIAQPGGQRQDVHLPAGVIDVILPRHPETGEVQQVGEARPVGGAAPVAHVQRPGRVGGDELHLQLAACAQRAAAEPRAGLQHGRHHLQLRRRGEEQVDEAGPRHLGLGQQRGFGQLGDQALGHVAGIELQRLGQLQGQVGGEVPVGGLLRPVQGDRRHRLVGGDDRQRPLQQLGELGLDVYSHGRGIRERANYTALGGRVSSFGPSKGAGAISSWCNIRWESTWRRPSAKAGRCLSFWTTPSSPGGSRFPLWRNTGCHSGAAQRNPESSVFARSLAIRHELV